MKLPKWVKNPVFLIGALGGIAWFIMPRDKYPVGSKWKHHTGEIWTVYSVRDEGNTIVFKTSGGQMTAPMPREVVADYVYKEWLVRE